MKFIEGKPWRLDWFKLLSMALFGALVGFVCGMLDLPPLVAFTSGAAIATFILSWGA